MVNRFRGEVALSLDGQAHVMRLTLGALAGLEEDLGTQSLVELVERFETGSFCARDLTALLFAGLRGGGWDGTKSDLAAANIDGGAVKAAEAAGKLLACAFGPE